jgi:hypothetical protein
MYLVPEDLFIVRDHPQRSIKALPSVYVRGQWHDSGKRRIAFMPHWRILLEYWKVVKRVPLSAWERLRARLCVGRSIFASWNWVRLLLDLLVAVQPRLWVVHLIARRWYRALKHRVRRHPAAGLPHGYGKG